MNNKSFISEVANRTGMDSEDAQMFAYTLVDVMNECFQKGDVVSFSNFGSFEVKKRMERIMVSPNTKKRMLVPLKLALVHYKRKNKKWRTSINGQDIDERHSQSAREKEEHTNFRSRELS